SGEYSGLPELEAVDGEEVPAPIPAVRRVVARKSAAATTPNPSQPESTQMMSATEIAAAREAMQREREQGRNRTIFWVVAAVLVAGSVVYSLGIIAAG